MWSGRRLDFLHPLFESPDEALRSVHRFLASLVPGKLVHHEELLRHEESGFVGLLMSATSEGPARTREWEIALALQELDSERWAWFGGFDMHPELSEYAIGDHVGFTAKENPETGALLLAGRASTEVARVTFALAGGISSTAHCRKERVVLATRRRRILQCAAEDKDGRVLSRLEPEGWLAELPEPPASGTWSFTLGTEFEAGAEGDEVD